MYKRQIPLAQAREGLNIKHDIALPVSAIPGFLAEVEPRPVSYTHLTLPTSDLV